MKESTYVEFMEFCFKLFFKYNLKVQKDEAKGVEFFDISDNKGNKYIATTKYYKSEKVMHYNISIAVEQIKAISSEVNRVLVIFSPVDDKIKSEIKRDHDISILDICNLLYLVKDDTTLHDALCGLMNNVLYDLSKYEGKEPIDIELFNDTSKLVSICSTPKRYIDYIDRLKGIKYGKAQFRKYEILCKEILEYLFNGKLTGFKEQERSDGGLNRMDLVCRITSSNGFWELIKQGFHSRYVVFEFKNYEDEVNQTQIYTTEKYLFRLALRNVSFLVTRKGVSENADKAINGVLRESGKLIVPLDDYDLITMLKLKSGGELPEDYLFEKVDDMLLSLSK
jgi:hypothetical protein